MEVSGRVTIDRTPSVVWLSLTDPTVMQACIPGCESFEQRSDQYYHAIVVAKLVFVKVHFHINIEIEAARRDAFYRFHAQGDGGLSGAAQGCCEITLTPASDLDVERTQLDYQATVGMHGILQKVAEPLLRKQAGQLVEKFFHRFESTIESSQLR